jgi:hypothetical protein
MHRRSAARQNARVQRPPFRPLQVEWLESRLMMAVSTSSLGVPQLSSRPGAPATLYLDFDGNVEQRWGSRTNVVTPTFDTDNNKASFSAAEVAAIREIWTRVAEDYAPFNINVTTVAPPVIADRVAARVAIGGSYSGWYGSSAGGVSYVGGFAGAASNVAYVFANTLGNNPRFIAEAASHEAGHLFGLEHQATWSGGQLVTEYASGTAALAPIMGVSYYADRSTWTKGVTSDGPAVQQDDLTIIASSTNGFGYAPDDYGNTIATATSLPAGGIVTGVIGRNDDSDVFKFTSGGGQVSFSLDVAQFGPDLDGVLELKNAAGGTIATANPATTFGASLTTTVTAGTYYLVVRSSGGYGNLGRYTLHGNVAGPVQPPSVQPAPPSSPPPAGSGTSPPATTTVPVVDDGTASFAATGKWTKLAGVGYGSDMQWAAAGSGAASAWTFTNLAPGQYQVAATWTGSGLNAVDAPFTVLSGNQLLATARVNQQRSASTFTSGGASWQNLGTVTITGNSLTVRLNSTASGRVVADAIRLQRVYSTGNSAVPRQAEMAQFFDSPDVAATPALSGTQPSREAAAVSIFSAVGSKCVQWTPTSPPVESKKHTVHDDWAAVGSDQSIDSAALDVLMEADPLWS